MTDEKKILIKKLWLEREKCLASRMYFMADFIEKFIRTSLA